MISALEIETSEQPKSTLISIKRQQVWLSIFALIGWTITISTILFSKRPPSYLWLIVPLAAYARLYFIERLPYVDLREDRIIVTPLWSSAQKIIMLDDIVIANYFTHFNLWHFGQLLLIQTHSEEIKIWIYTKNIMITKSETFGLIRGYFETKLPNKYIEIAHGTHSKTSNYFRDVATTPTQLNTPDSRLNVIAALSFIPFFGILYGVIAIVWGLLRKTSEGIRSALYGLNGITLTVIIGLTIQWYVDSLMESQMPKWGVLAAQAEINKLVVDIEFYKRQYGDYPSKLSELKQALPNDFEVNVNDVSYVSENSETRHFYYERVDQDHYYLLGSGRDGKPFTSDDLLPQIPSASESKIGLMIDQRSKPLEQEMQ